MAEESNIYHPVSDGNVWVLDLIDGMVNFVVQEVNPAVMIVYYENGKGQFGSIYNVANDILHSGDGQSDIYTNGRQLISHQDMVLKQTLTGCNASMFSCSYCGVRDLIDQTLSVRVYSGTGLSIACVITGQLLAYFSHIQPWDYAATRIMGEKLGYVLLIFNGGESDFATHQKVMFVPE